MTTSDDFGDGPGAVSDFLEVFESRITGMAVNMGIGRDNPKFDDAVQEGLIAAWKAFEENEPGVRIAYAIQTAKYRIREMALKHNTKPTGGSEKRRYEPVAEPLSGTDDKDGGEFTPEVFIDHDALEGVEMAYHYGEIQEAISRLTPRQRQYVFARFWCGMDPDGIHMNPGMREARTNNPFLRRDILWTGSKTALGAKRKLAEDLAHLV